MKFKKIITIIIILLFFSTIFNNFAMASDIKSADLLDFSYKQKIQITFDTIIDQTKYQPIDIKFEFLNSCYAKDEKDNSIRVGMEKGGEITELESQIYNLEKIDETHISSCGLVFLIPKEADGTEEYYVFYDSIKTEISEYEKYLFLEDSHYFYEPIPGQKIDFDYFGIKQKDDVIYAVVQRGELLGNPIALSVAKFKPGSKVVETYNLDQLCDLDFRYGIFEEPAYFGTSWATEISKQIIVDGNLMIRVRIQCISPRGDIKTDNIYTYYYCPTETKRIYIDVSHQILKDIDIEEPSVEDGVIAGITSIKSRSASIEKMNVGEILPEVYLYSKDDTVLDFSINLNPDSIDREMELSTEDNIDLGAKAWTCLYNPSNGKSHGLIFNSNKGITDGDDDGVQVKAFVKQNIKLPGLEADTGNIILTRNAYENGKHNTKLNIGTQYNFKVEFITVEKDGYKIIDEESIIYQNLIKNIPVLRENVTHDEEEIVKYSLKTYVHLAPSAPLGSLLSAALGKNIPYIYAELYKENNFKSSGVVSRISLGSIDFDLEDKNLIQIIKTVFGIFDWKNFSFFKKIVFPDLESGTYVVKIFKENPIFVKQRRYIGFGIIDLKKNDTLRIYCRPEGKIKLLFQDQNKLGIENIKINLLSDNIVISESISDKNGTAIVYAPCFPLKKYILRIIYNGFLIEEKELNLDFKNYIIDLQESYLFELFDVTLSLRDTWDLEPAVDVNPKITSNEMIEPNFLFGKENDNGQYIFYNLTPGKYQLSMSYKSFSLEKEINIINNLKLYFDFPAEYSLSFNVYDSYGEIFSDGQISIARSDKVEKFEINQRGFASITIPPGIYQINVISNDKEIAKQNIEIKGEKNINIINSEDSFLHKIMVYLGIIMIIFAIAIIFWKKNFYNALKIIAIALLIISLFSPWWILNGEDGVVKSTTKTFLIPQKIVTFSSTSNILGGEISQVPDEVTIVLELLMFLLIISCLLIFVSVFISNKFKKTSITLSILIIILLIVTLSIFYYALSQLTEVGIGNFMGSGEIEITIPGVAEAKLLPCTWGPSIGFYLALLTIILFMINFIYHRYIKKV
jgi:hypothetical protein